MKFKEEHSFWAYFSESLQQLDRQIPFLAKENPQKIHQFRLGIKRLFFMLDMLSYRMDNELPFERVKYMLLPLYKAAGAVRTHQMHIKQLNKIEIPHVQIFMRDVLRKKENAITMLKYVSSQMIYSAHYPITEVVFDILHPNSEEGLPFLYVQKMQGEESFIHQNIVTNTNSSQWHTIRKSMKCLIFLDTLEPLFYNLISISPVYMHRLKQMERAIGAWHDKQMLQKALNKFLNTNPEFMVNVNMIRLRYKLKSQISDVGSKLIQSDYKQLVTQNQY